VAAVVARGIQADADVLAAARQGAQRSGAAFASLDVASARTARALSRWQSGASDPAVLVVRRPGRVVGEIDGWSDATMVAELVASAR
jgi:hypothetical protein